MRAQEPIIFLMKKLWHFADDKRKNIVIYIVMFMMANMIVLAGPVIFGAFIGEVQRNGLSKNNLGYLLVLLGAIFCKELFFWSIHGPARVIERMVAFHATLNYRRYLLAGVFDLRLSWHNEHDSGDTIDKIDKAGEGFFDFGQNVFQIVDIIVKLFGTSIVLFFYSPTIGSFVFTFAVMSLFIVFQFDKRLVPQYRRINEMANKASAAVFDALSNITTVKILHIETSVQKGVLARYAAPRELFHTNTKINEYKWFTGHTLFQTIATVSLVFFIVNNVNAGDYVDAGMLSTLFLYLSEFMFVFFRFGSNYEEITVRKNRVANAESLEQAFKIRESLVRAPIKNDWHLLNVHDLSFSYDKDNVLAKISFHLKRGERVAIIGESGSGKTTFLKVLHGMFPKASGHLQIDGKDFRQTSFVDVDLRTMLVPQEPEIFSSTIRENITLGVDYDDTKVMHAARIAEFDSVIAQLPRGLDSVINEKGVNLSGGQKQRLALTRALLYSESKEIILLDESTSSVDPEHEFEIYQNIWSAFSSKTVIASIHKMNLLKLFDRIVMFENSRIVDEGTFSELLARNKNFKQLWDTFIAEH